MQHGLLTEATQRAEGTFLIVTPWEDALACDIRVRGLEVEAAVASHTHGYAVSTNYELGVAHLWMVHSPVVLRGKDLEGRDALACYSLEVQCKAKSKLKLHTLGGCTAL